MEETMNMNRRMLIVPALALGLLGMIPGSVVPAFAGADEDAIAKNLETFRAAQAAGKAEGLASICAEELSYSHSNGAVDDKATLLSGITNANYKWTSLEYKNPTIRVGRSGRHRALQFRGRAGIHGRRQEGPQNLHILMNWQKQGTEWKLLSRAATRL
jgi:hypothetical protein